MKPPWRHVHHNTGPAPGHYPARLAWLRTSSTSWETDGLLDDAQAAAILGSYQASRRFSLAHLLLSIGAVFLGFGLIWLVAANLDALSPLGPVRPRGRRLARPPRSVGETARGHRRQPVPPAVVRRLGCWPRSPFGAVVFQAAQCLQVPAYEPALVGRVGARRAAPRVRRPCPVPLAVGITAGLGWFLWVGRRGSTSSLSGVLEPRWSRRSWRPSLAAPAHALVSEFAAAVARGRRAFWRWAGCSAAALPFAGPTSSRGTRWLLAGWRSPRSSPRGRGSARPWRPRGSSRSAGAGCRCRRRGARRCGSPPERRRRWRRSRTGRTRSSASRPTSWSRSAWPSLGTAARQLAADRAGDRALVVFTRSRASRSSPGSSRGPGSSWCSGWSSSAPVSSSTGPAGGLAVDTRAARCSMTADCSRIAARGRRPAALVGLAVHRAVRRACTARTTGWRSRRSTRSTRSAAPTSPSTIPASRGRARRWPRRRRAAYVYLAPQTNGVWVADGRTRRAARTAGPTSRATTGYGRSAAVSRAGSCPGRGGRLDATLRRRRRRDAQGRRPRQRRGRRRAPDGPDRLVRSQPPATAGITEIWVPSGVGGLEVLEEAHVVVADVHVDEPAQLAALVEDPALDAGVVRVEVVEHRGEGAAARRSPRTRHRCRCAGWWGCGRRRSRFSSVAAGARCRWR